MAGVPYYVDWIKWVGNLLYDGNIDLVDRSGAQSAPSSGRIRLYSKAQALYTVNAAGTESIVGSGLTQSQILARGLLKR